MPIKSLAVFCGSREGTHVGYAQAAHELGLFMAKQGVKLIYGGGNVGLMGAMANGVLVGGGTAVGVIPQFLVDRERSHQGLSELHVVEDMHIRKRKMYELCDAALVLPGGHGTLDEFFEMITWNNLALHDKTIFVFNILNFYTHLLKHIDLMQDQGFLYGAPMEKIEVIQKPDDLLPYL